jgi:hypothetical protein
MAETKSNQGAKADLAFAVYQQESGSLTLAGHRLTPLAAHPVPTEVEKLACSDSLPVRFFKTEDAAKENVEKLRTDFLRKRKPA